MTCAVVVISWEALGTGFVVILLVLACIVCLIRLTAINRSSISCMEYPCRPVVPPPGLRCPINEPLACHITAVHPLDVGGVYMLKRLFGSCQRALPRNERVCACDRDSTTALHHLSFSSQGLHTNIDSYRQTYVMSGRDVEISWMIMPPKSGSSVARSDRRKAFLRTLPSRHHSCPRLMSKSCRKPHPHEGTAIFFGSMMPLSTLDYCSFDAEPGALAIDTMRKGESCWQSAPMVPSSTYHAHRCTPRYRSTMFETISTS